MAFERYWLPIPPQNFTSDGTNNGIVTIADTARFKAKQTISLSAAGLPTIVLEVKRVLSPTTLVVGPKNKNINTRSDISVYTVIANSTIQAPLQDRANLTLTDHERAVYEEEPTLAKRCILVDEYGDKYNEDNAFPVEDKQWDLEPEHINGTIAIAGTPSIITPSSGKPIKCIFIMCNTVNDPWNPNNITDAVRFSLDSGTTWTSLMSGESQYLYGIIDSFRIDSNVNDVKYQLILWT